MQFHSFICSCIVLCSCAFTQSRWKRDTRAHVIQNIMSVAVRDSTHYKLRVQETEFVFYFLYNVVIVSVLLWCCLGGQGPLVWILCSSIPYNLLHIFVCSIPGLSTAIRVMNWNVIFFFVRILQMRLSWRGWIFNYQNLGYVIHFAIVTDVPIEIAPR